MARVSCIIDVEGYRGQQSLRRVNGSHASPHGCCARRKFSIAISLPLLEKPSGADLISRL